MRNFFLITILAISIAVPAKSQELQARLSVIAGKISSQVDKKVFQTLQGALNDFLNNRRWSNDNFQTNEKIQCSFLLTLVKELGNNMYQATLTVQAARPV